MSSQRNTSQRYGSGTLSGSLGRGPSGPGGSGSYSKGYGSGLVSLGTTKKPRTATSLPERKLSVPRPVNLPSLRKENAGNDPNTQLVPSGGGGGWQRPEQKEEVSQEPAPNLTAGSNWASAPSNSGVPSWQPPQPFPVATAAAPRGRSLNPHEYPSLSAAATSKQPTVTKQPLPHLPTSGSQGGGNWDEDERKSALAPPLRSTGESWADSRFEDDERPAYRPPWETNGRTEWRGPASENPHGRAYGGGNDELWNSRGQPTPRGGTSSKPPLSGYDRFREVEDPALFPPPPPPRHPPPPPPPRPSEASREEAEAEKRAFEEEIDRVIEEERRRKREGLEASRARIESQSPESPAISGERVLARPPPPPPPPPPPQLTEEQQAAAVEAARQKVLAMRRQREAEALEAERLRKEAAAAKLKALEERIAAKEAAEREAKVKELQAAATADSSADDSAGSVLTKVEEAAAAALDASSDGALLSAAKAAFESPLHQSPSKDSLAGNRVGSSVEAEATSSVGQPEGGLADLDAMAGGGPIQGTPGQSAGDIAAWSKTPAQPKAIWQRKDRDATRGAVVGSPQPSTSRATATLPPPLQSKDETGASALFGSSSGFGPALVATSLGISPDELAAQNSAVPQTPVSQAPVAFPPPTGTATGPMSWRAVLGAREVTEDKINEVSKAEEPPQPRQEAAGRGRGRGRRDREHLNKDDRQGSGGRGERGRARQDRGRGRGRGRQDAKDDASVASVGASSLNESGSSTAYEGRKPAQRQRGEGRGRGGRDGQPEGRGRGRGQRPAPTATAAAPAPPPPPPEIAERPPALPPGIPRAAELVLPPAETSQSPSQLEPTGQREGASGSGWGPVGLQADLLQISQLNLNKSEGSPRVSLDPVAPLLGAPDTRNDRAIDRPIERPKSAAGVVGRPKSATPENLLPNGMPVLPNDLSLDAPSDSARVQNPASITFGFNPPQQPSGLSPGPFPGVFFPAQHGSSNPWQPASTGSQMQPNLEAAVESFYKAGSPSLGSTFTQAPGSQPPSSGLQFGAFGAHSFPQFGQLGSSFGHAPFIHTGKQPDWSTGPISSTPSSSGLRPPDQLPYSTGAGGFSRPQGMDAIVPSANIQKRGGQGAPGPPGLQRQAPGPPLFQGAPGMQHQSRPQQVQPPVRPPPGLQQHSAPGGPPFGGPLSQSPGGFRGDGLLGGLSFPDRPEPRQFNLPQQPPPVQGPPPGIGAPVHNALPSARDVPVSLPDNVFETSNMKLGDATPAQAQLQSQPPPANGQVRRSGEGRGGRGVRGSGNRGQPRGRNFSRGHTGRSMQPQPLSGSLPFHQGGPPGVLQPHSFPPQADGFPAVGLAPSGMQENSQNFGELSHNASAPLKRDGRGAGRGKVRGRSDRGRGRDGKFAVSQGYESTGPEAQPSG